MARLALARRLTARRAAALAVAAVAVGGTLAATLPAGASTTSPPPVSSGSRYLALGDSVTFGYRESTSTPTPDYNKPGTLVGFPRIVANDLHLKLTNASCPGETTGSFIDTTKPTNGCERGSGNQGTGYRTAYPLHVQYTSPNESQLNYAIEWLKNHRQTKLVTLMIGANDGFLCQETTPDHCTSPTELNGVLTKVEKNVNQILLRLRRGALYKGQLVIVNYYSTDYSDANQTALSAALNQAVDSVAKKYNAVVAPSFQLFKKAAAEASGSTCNAGLLTMLTGGGCGVHPSFAGQTLLASSVERVTKTS